MSVFDFERRSFGANRFGEVVRIEARNLVEAGRHLDALRFQFVLSHSVDPLRLSPMACLAMMQTMISSYRNITNFRKEFYEDKKKGGGNDKDRRTG